MILDANANVGPAIYDDFEFDPTLNQLQAQLDAAGIDGAVVAPLKPPSFDFDQANARLAHKIQELDHFYPIGRIDPRVTESIDHAEQALADYGMYGLKLHPWEESFSITDSQVSPILDVAASYNAPVWLHAGYPGVSYALSIRDIAQNHPGTKFILTHGAQLDISGLSLSDALLLAKDTENTYFELSGVYRRDLIQDLVDQIGASRVLFGTNAPYFHPKVEKIRVTKGDISDGAKEQVLSESLSDLL